MSSQATSPSSRELHCEAVEQSSPNPPPSSVPPVGNASHAEGCAGPAVATEALAAGSTVLETSCAQCSDLPSEHCTASSPLLSHRQGLRGGGQRAPGSRAPTYFLAIPLHSPEVHGSVSDLQSAMIRRREWLSSVAEPAVRLHVALFALNLAESPVDGGVESGNEVNSIGGARAVLHACKDAVDRLMADHSHRPPLLPLTGLSNFGQKVVFASFPAEHPSLHLLRDLQRLVLNEFRKAGISIQNGGQRYHPHAALFRDSSRRLRPKVWNHWANDALGECPLREIQLLERGVKEGVFYKSHGTLPLGNWPTRVTAQATAQATGVAGSYAAVGNSAATCMLSEDHSACVPGRGGAHGDTAVNCEASATSETPLPSSKTLRKYKSKYDQPPREFPTHFIGVALKSSKVRTAVEEAQASMIEETAWLKEIVDHHAAVKLHVTLLVLTLGQGSSDESLAKISSAQAVLQSCREDVANLMAGFPDGFRHSPRLPLAGLSNFGKSVVFADFPEGHRSLALLKDLEELFRRKFQAAGLLADAGGRPFRPHATLFKDSRRRLSKSVWEAWADAEFGECRLEEVQLLKMGAPEGQFYKSLGVLPLGDWAEESADSDGITDGISDIQNSLQ